MITSTRAKRNQNMDVEKVFRMTGGTGDNSYAKNSSYQKKVSDMVKHITMDALQQVYLALAPKSLGIADLGCSSGSNSLSIIKDIVESVEAASCKIMIPAPEFRVYLNDLPTNDFNSIFKSLPDFYRDLNKERSGGLPLLFIAGYPGSFYGRLFPNDCLHFVHSSYSLHWLSKVPPSLYDKQGKPINRGSVHISASSPPLVSQAYYAQFQEDFSLFLRSRSEELTAGGRMVLIMLGRIGPDHVDRGNSFYWELLSRSLTILATQGEIKREDIDSYDVHFYAPTKDEMEAEIRREGSFEVERLEMLETEKELYKVSENYGTEVAMTVRAIQESMLSHHFGEGILDTLFEIYGRMVEEEMLKEEMNPITFVLVLRKL
ncbi:S-ADENOSYL-L-METHIONINE:CARBOXYL METHYLTRANSFERASE FAMILY PROTEIN [Salix purpurea]|uniref:S-ADENOSYL-L-METHIONINE:CARBOXYL METHYLTRANSFERASE FAMILY PROTEIN n=2 Tax=Salix purpurea TaxID=77065 RepID=A0A9Q0V0W2_SALPP|nr:S-ADENOSYL-L-METHIONINE:CARBOXYL METHYLTRANSFERASE FAMILY PROTEIN [Salix purpurea]